MIAKNSVIFGRTELLVNVDDLLTQVQRLQETIDKTTQLIGEGVPQPLPRMVHRPSWNGRIITHKVGVDIEDTEQFRCGRS